jgi:ABC-type transport system involved in cytochrome bd biosynthesis fused ATPase/permease subunit
MDCFSGGEIHRLGLLRAWLQDRPIEVLDEPTAFLDAATAIRVRRILGQRSRERLVVVSSHDPELIALASTVVRRQPADRAAAVARHGLQI